MKKAYMFYSDLYNHNIYFCPGFAPKELEHAINSRFRMDYEFTRNDSQAITIDVINTKGRGGIFIWTKEKTGLGALVHECIHAANYILGPRGIRYTADNDEVLAYLVQWIFANCYKHIKGKI